MNRFRLRGTWEDDPTPIPFPAGRDAGSTEAKGAGDFVNPPSTDAIIRGVESELERASLKIDELRDLMTPFDSDPPPAA